MRTPMAVIVVLLVVAGAGSAVAAGDDYAITLSPEVDTPDRSITIEGDRYPVTSVGRVDPGEPLTATVTAPDRDYHVVVYDAERRRFAMEAAHGDATIEFDTSGWSRGSYIVAVESDGEVETVQPLVVSAYDVAVTAPGTAIQGSDLEITASLDDTGGDERIQRVEVAIAQNGADWRAELTETGDGEYAGTVPTDDLPPGDYSLYVLVRGTTMSEGRFEVLAAPDPRALTIQEGEPPGTETAATESTTPTDAPITTASPTTVAGVTADGVITPGQSPTTATTTAVAERAGLPGWVGLVLVALGAIAAVLLVRARYRAD